jgi:hypothetical protein
MDLTLTKVINMVEGKDGFVNKLSEEDLELQRFVKKGNKLKWTWIIGTLVIIFSILDGETAQLLLAGAVAVYIFIATVNYFKSVSS